MSIAYDPHTQRGSYFFQMQPGTVTTRHEHPGCEEFHVIEGEAVETDETVI